MGQDGGSIQKRLGLIVVGLSWFVRRPVAPRTTPQNIGSRVWPSAWSAWPSHFLLAPLYADNITWAYLGLATSALIVYGKTLRLYGVADEAN